MKSIIRRCISLAVSISIVLSTFTFSIIADAAENFIYNCDFEAYATNAVPDNLALGTGGGDITVKQLYNNKALFLSNEHDGSFTEIRKEYASVYAVPVRLSLKYMQPDSKVNGTVIAEIGADGTSVASVETENGNIIYKTAGISKAMLVSNYSVNRWYKFDITFNLYTKTAEIKVDDKVIASGLPINGNKADYYASYTCYSPGFYLDNIILSTDQTPGSIIVADVNNPTLPINNGGKTVASIPDTFAREYTYKITVKDNNNVEIPSTDCVLTQVENTIGAPGISKYETPVYNGKYLTLKIYPGCPEGNIKYKISCAGVNFEFTIEIRNDAVGKVVIRGNQTISYYPKADNTYEYKAVIYNDQGISMGTRPADTTWSVEGNPANVSINTAGILTVNGELPRNNRFTIKAVYNDGADKYAGELQITMLDWKTYRDDVLRMNALELFANELIDGNLSGYYDSDNPLIADGMDVLAGRPFEWNYPSSAVNPAPAALSDLASQGYIMRTFDGLSELTGNVDYKNYVRKIYQYYLDNYIADNGLPYWGGHTSIDLKTGNVSYGSPDVNTHELKDNYPYMQPFTELDRNTSVDIMKKIFGGHITKINNGNEIMNFNRHATFTSDIDLSWWDMDYDDNYTLTELYPTDKLPFRMAAADFIYMMIECYRATDDVTALKWGRRLWKKYADVSDSNTCLGGYVFTSAKDWSERDDYPVEDWYNVDPMPESYTYSNYGDRAYNQYYDIMLEAITDENDINHNVAVNWDMSKKYYSGEWSLNDLKAHLEGMVREANTIFGPGYMQWGAMVVEQELAQELIDTGDPELEEWGREIERYTARRLASYAKYAYIPETNKCKPVWTDGADMTDFVVRRSGYFYMGNKNYVMRHDAATDGMFYAYLMTYIYTDGRDDLADDRQEIWKVIRHMAMSKGLGDWGINGPENPKVNLATTDSTAQSIMIACYLYKVTDNTDYLDLARAVADNLVDGKFHENLFKESTGYQNIFIGGSRSAMPYSVMLLEYAIRGRLDELPHYMPCAAQFTADLIVNDGGRIEWKQQSSSTVWIQSIPAVKVQSITMDSESYTLQTGESKNIKYTIYPDDASSKSIQWMNSDPTVARYDSSSGTLYGISRGTTVLTGFSGDKNAKVEFVVTVE